MQKVVDFLERYCQWVAVGIGALFFVFALYQYLPIVRTPVTVDIAGTPMEPGEVDREIVSLAADPLEARMSEGGSITVTVPNYNAQVIEKMTTTPKLAPLPGFAVAARPVELPSLPWDVSATDQPGVAQVELPQLPVAVLNPPPGTGFAQVTPVAAGANADVVWVRVPFTISMGQMGSAFQMASIPGAFTQTNFVRVELVRQRLLANGAWGPEEVVPTIETAGIVPVPTDSQNVAALLAYKTWATEHQQQIVQPTFYPVIAGDNPLMPTLPTATATATPGDPALGGFDPETFPPNGDLSTLSPEQKAAVLAVRQRRAREAEESRRNRGGDVGGGMGGGGGGGRGPGGGGGGPGGRSDDGTNNGRGPIVTWQFQPNPGGPIPPGGPGTGDYPGMPPAVDPNAPINLPPIANSPFIPQAGMPDVQGHAYDMTATPGATYRYRIRYSIANPLYQAVNVIPPGGNQALINVFEIFAEDGTKWTEPITVKSNIHAFLAVQPNAGNAVVRFTVFRWQNGKWNRSIQNFSAGDSIGKVEGGVDYRSTLSLVEVRRDGSSERPYAILMSDDGAVQKRDFDMDSSSQLLRELNAAVDGPPPPPMNPGMPGMPGMPGGPAGGYPPGGGGAAGPTP